MVRNLIEYKQYLPQSVLQDSHSDDGLASDANTPSSQSCASRTSKSCRSAKQEVLYKLQSYRQVSLVLMNVKGFLQIAKAQCSSELNALHASYLESAVFLVRSTRGMIDEFVGDKVHASFNSLMSCAGHRAAAAQCLSDLSTTTFNNNLEVNGAAVSMKALCGNFGCTGLKKYTVLGVGGARVWTYERWGRAWGVQALIDDRMEQETSVNFSLRRVAKVRVTPKRDEFLYEVLGCRAAEEGEWMYQMESSVGGPVPACNDAVDLLYKGQFAQAQARLKNFTGADGHHVAPLKKWIEDCVETNTAPSPLPVACIPHPTHACVVTYDNLPELASI
eukprot:TRINITY_DN43107_c0_g1_i1.p1 TRINITY_DN43107_c0_g1~~TRINITY_DN43107_c0_g1_i1.p1  ORF type:complete len:354 (+),score=95.13 TRINITY_DN43107_c0_g1_i1:65-1063(+)